VGDHQDAFAARRDDLAAATAEIGRKLTSHLMGLGF
jgi:hypothetical protein